MTGVSVTPAQRDAVASAAQAAGVTMSAYLLAAVESARAAERTLREARTGHRAELARLGRAHEAQGAKLGSRAGAERRRTAERTRPAVATAEARGPA